MYCLVPRKLVLMNLLMHEPLVYVAVCVANLRSLVKHYASNMFPAFLFLFVSLHLWIFLSIHPPVHWHMQHASPLNMQRAKKNIVGVAALITKNAKNIRNRVCRGFQMAQCNYTCKRRTRSQHMHHDPLGQKTAILLQVAAPAETEFMSTIENPESPTCNPTKKRTGEKTVPSRINKRDHESVAGGRLSSENIRKEKVPAGKEPTCPDVQQTPSTCRDHHQHPHVLASKQPVLDSSKRMFCLRGGYIAGRGRRWLWFKILWYGHKEVHAGS